MVGVLCGSVGSSGAKSIRLFEICGVSNVMRTFPRAHMPSSSWQFHQRLRDFAHAVHSARKCHQHHCKIKVLSPTTFNTLVKRKTSPSIPQKKTCGGNKKIESAIKSNGTEHVIVNQKKSHTALALQMRNQMRRAVKGCQQDLRFEMGRRRCG